MLLLNRPIDGVLDSPFNPWAHSWRGEPTLVGTWVGMITSPSGQRMALFLDLHRSRDSRGHFSSCAQCPRIEGIARLCGSRGGQRYEVWGSLRVGRRVEGGGRSAQVAGWECPVGLTPMTFSG